MVTTAQQALTTTSTERADERQTLSRTLLVALIALVALTMAVAAWQLRTTTATPNPASAVPKAAADPWAAYRPGGSVYQQQVPHAAADPWAAYRPGGSVYQQQVPHAGG